jgi:hypothetical protein
MIDTHHDKQQQGMESPMDWKQLLAYITGSVDGELRLRNEYLEAESGRRP